ncbi:hypothetical protein ACQCX2_14385 [Propionibacteriaceae bacterium Y1700]|uniref:hypothetical protein n=1 Tax=Microlunatus sp. Y1700 TaxID=3418487 RepID=UPI003DA6F86B
MKHALSRGGTGLLVLGLVTAVLGLPTLRSEAVEPPTPEVQAVVDADPNITYLGEPVQVSQSSAPAIGVLDGRQVSYQVFKGTANSENPGAFTAVDLLTGEVVLDLPMATADTARALTVASDGKVYAATYFDQKLWQFDPATRQLRDLGTYEPEPTDAQPFGLCNGPHGQVFIPTYKHSALYKYDPAADKITQVRIVNPANTYLHACAWDPKTNDLYVSAGGTKAELWRIADLGTGAMTKMTSEATTPGMEAETFLMGMWLIGDHLFARTKNLRFMVMGTDGVVDHWTQSQTIGGYHVIPVKGQPDKVLYTYSGHVMEYSISAATVRDTGMTVKSYFGDAVHTDDGSLIGTDAVGTFRLAADGTYSGTPINFSQPTAIQKLLAGPNGKMFASGYPTGLAEVDTTGGGTVHPSLSSGQYESAVVRNGSMFVGHYGNAKFSSFDPSRPAAAPKLIFDGLAEHQDRPMAMAYNPDRDEVYMGTIAAYGTVQGGLAVYDAATREHVWLDDEIVANQSIISVTYNPADKLVYIGTNVDGGMGIEQPAGMESELVVWDPATRQVVRRLVPVADREGVTGLLVAPDGMIWGWAEDTFFVYDPAKNQVTHTQGGLAPRYVDGQFYWAWAFQYASPIDGNVYVTVGSKLLRIDPDTLQVTQIATGAAFGNIDTVGDIYFSSRSHAYKYVVPRPVADGPPTTESKCAAVTTLLEGRSLSYDGLKPAWQGAYKMLERQVDSGKGEQLKGELCR